LLTGFLAALSAALVYRSEWRGHNERASQLASSAFGPVWAEPLDRAVLLESFSETFQIRLQLRDVSEQLIAQAGGECRQVHFSTSVVGPSGALGRLNFCGPIHAARHWVFAWALFLGSSVLWLASGWVARRLGRPLKELTEVTRRIGEGQLGSRVHLRGRPHDELAELAVSVNEMAGRIEKQIRDQRELLAFVSHEIRTPLGHLKILMELLEREGISAKRQEQLEREVTAIDRLVADLLANARLEFEAVDPRALKAGDLVATALERAHLPASLLNDLSANRPFQGDPTLLHRALHNLMDNASRHGQGLACVTVELRAPRGLVFRVADLGPGVPEAERESAFRAFHRVSSGDGEQSSLGLGLALVRRIAEAHGGTAWAGAAGEKGSEVCFSVRLDADA
jgi:signal transduction histidine kinase